MKFTPFILFALEAMGPTLATAMKPSLPRHLYRRQDTCNIQFAQSTGDRKVAIVIDSSGSMDDNDPLNLRIDAGKGLNKQLIPGSDQVAVIDFDSSATVAYPLGDPAGAESSFDTIDSFGSTDIAEGLETGIAQITSGSGITAGHSGIVVLTDGQDTSITALITQLEDAAAKGIRVSFGFLSVSLTNLSPDLLSAILRTGGTYTTFDTPDKIQSFLFLVLSNGIAESDVRSTVDQPLLPGVTIAKLTAGSTDTNFRYKTRAGEVLDFTVESLSSQDLVAELQDADGAVLGRADTASAVEELAVISYTAVAVEALRLVVKLAIGGAGTDEEGVFQVKVDSSLGIADCNLNNTAPANTTTPVVATPTPTPSTVLVNEAGRVVGIGIGVVGFVMAMLM